MLANLTDREQQIIRDYIEHQEIYGLKPYQEKVTKCIEEQKYIPKKIQMIITKLHFIKPISHIIVQYMGPIHSHFFEIVLKNIPSRSGLGMLWWDSHELCIIVKQYNKTNQSWNIPDIFNINHDTSCRYDNVHNICRTLINYDVDVNVHINAKTNINVKITEFLNSICVLFMTGRNHQGLELEHPNIFTFEPRKGKNTYKINIKKMKQRERIVQRIEQSNQYSSQQKILKIRKRTKQSNKKNTFQKSNYQKRSYGFSH